MQKVKRYIKALKIGGYSQDEAKEFIELLIQNNGYKVDSMQALLQIETIYKMGRERSLAHEITEWAMGASGWWDTKALDIELRILGQSDKGNRRFVLHSLIEQGILERHPKRNGVYRRIEVDSRSIDWKNADPRNVLDVKFPFELHRYIKTFPGTIGIVAGSKEEGKTAFADNFILLNQNNPALPQPIYLFTSEGVEEEMHERFLNFGIPIDDWTFEAKRRTTDFADAIVKDHINVIDYLEQRGGEYYLIRDEIAKISDNLGNGYCLICLQKPPGRDYGLGGYGTTEKCRLYLTMDNKTLKILYAKSYKGKINPKGWRWRFNLDKSRGTYFNDIEQLDEI